MKSCMRRMTMRDPKRIKPLLEQIEKVWLKHPDLRLCQLLSNHFPDCNDLFYIEDDKLMEELKSYDEERLG